MQPYQQTYIDNCRAIREMITSEKTVAATLSHARDLMQQNTRLLSEELFPVLDDLYALPQEEQEGLETFADALLQGPQTDSPLAAQIFEALVSVARQRREREPLIRLLYKLGMARYNMYLTLYGIQTKMAEDLCLRMRYCFSEAAGYLRFFEEFPAETQAYIIRSQANIYLGVYNDWHTKLACVRRSLQIVTDAHYRELAPSLPWERYEFAVHQQMTGALSYETMPEDVEADDIVDVLEAAHLVYEDQFARMRESGQTIQPRWLMPYYAMEFACGVSNRETLLMRIEKIIDGADVTSYDAANLYANLSAPAFYTQYLGHMPEQRRDREIYLRNIYRRVLHYIGNMPDECIAGDGGKQALRVIDSFTEVPGGPTMLHMSLYILRRTAPEIFAHGIVSGWMSQQIAKAILADDPEYFSDVPELRENPTQAPKLAFFAGALHDVGMTNFRTLSGNNERQMLNSEFELRQIHTWLGGSLFAANPSTRSYADTAYGHHRWYDGSDGYPQDYDRLESPYRAITDIVALADYLDSNSAEDMLEPLRDVAFEQKRTEALALSGRRFSPMVTARLRDKALCARLQELYDCGYREALEIPVPVLEDSEAFLKAIYREEPPGLDK